MKTVMFIGVVLIVISVFSFAYQGITYTSREKVIDVGPIEPLLKSNKLSRFLPSSVLSRLSVVLL
jgi:hypothetical protein